MKYLILCLLLTSCATTKPFFFSAERQDKEIVIPMAVFFGDYQEAEVKNTVTKAVDEFYQRTNIRPVVGFYRHVEWESREFYAMSKQVFALYPDGVIPARWVLMIYKKTPMEWALLSLIGNVEGLAEAGGHWAMVNRLSVSLIVHELYHLGWRIQ